MTFNTKGDVKLDGIWNDEEIQKSGKFSKNVSSEIGLVLRTLNLNSRRKYVIDIIQKDIFPELTAYKMYFEVVGEEEVKVPAGTFYCKKVLFTLSGWQGLFYKCYNYITNDERRIIVRMDNMPRGGQTYLIAIE